ncbi:MAG: dual specificity protein phosphatase family protein [Bacteroidetes bacterium]|nr:dual specificity protein phosphatase family protein [Bacteroidota bacterium]
MKSIWLVVVIFVQKVWDQLHRGIVGIPTLRRSQITANLFLGGQYNLRGLRLLKEMGITGVINMRMHSVYVEARYQGLEYLHLPTPDNTPPKLEDLIRGAEFAHSQIEAGGKVYIHCRQGLGRGPTMAIAYLLRMGQTYADAFATVKRVRTFINPRAGQVARLKELEVYYGGQQKAETKLAPRI